MLTRETFAGPWAGLPVAWKPDGSFDEGTYRSDVRRCCKAGVPGVYSGGTSGEFYAVEIDEFAAISRATIAECRALGVPVMIGCSATSTRGATRRARIASELGADAVQVTLPFWMEVPDSEIVSFFQAVSDAAEGLTLSVYETLRCKKRLTIEQHHAIHSAIPGYLMVKANTGTVGDTPEGCADLSEFLNVFVPEVRWTELAPHGIAGACSAMVYWNPALILDLWKEVRSGISDRSARLLEKIEGLHQFLAREFAPRGFTDSAYDRLVGKATGFLKTSLSCRAPYPHANEADLDLVRAWCDRHFPELISSISE